MPKRVHAMLSRPEIEHITIDMKFKNFQKLAYERQIAIAKGVLFSSSEDFVKAEIRYKDKTLKVEIRLKGDEIDHFEGDKWSFRIKIKGKDTLFGMKYFSIQHPNTRNYIYEWILHQALKREGLIYHRYKFVDVTLNGKDLGIYALEEHVAKELIEHNQRRNGPIIKFSEDILWEEFIQQLKPFPNATWNGGGAYTASDIDVFQTGQWTADSVSSMQLRKAIDLLESFRRGDLSTSEVFDVKILATYFAIMDLLGASNGTQWVNVRFYYNPISSRLEPIGRDGFPRPLERLSAMRSIITNQFEIFNELYFAHLFKDRLFFIEYIKALERISQPSYVDKLFSAIKDELEENLDILYTEFPEFSFSKDIIYQNQRYIQTVLNPVKGLHAYYHKSFKDRIELELGNIQYLPIEVLSVSYKDSVLFHPVENISLQIKVPTDPVDYRNISFIFPEDLVWSDTLIKDLKVNYKLLGTSQLRHETVFPWSHLGDNFIENDILRQKANCQKFKFLIIDESTKEIYVKSGRWTLDQNMIIPKGYRVVAGEDTQLNLLDSAMILSYSPLELIGSKDYPIIIQSTDSTGQGFVVMSAEQPSILDYVTFYNLSNPSQSGWELTGAVTFYESPVQIFHSQVVGNRSEDALNIVRSEYTIDNTIFRKISADAFDGDFTKGKIANSTFVDIGNDAIDVSESVIDLQDVFINGAGDKGLSAGENSKMTVNHIDIKNAEIAVASKDLSDIAIQNINISDGEIGLTAYQKKPEFGAASIKVASLKMIGVNIPYLVEEQSTVVVDGVTIASNRKNIKDILYGREYGKSSK